MPVIPLSQFELSRTRRDISEAVQRADWQAVSVLDRQLGEVLETATGDTGRDNLKILDEMTRLLQLYKQVMKTCHEQQQQLSSELIK